MRLVCARTEARPPKVANRSRSTRRSSGVNCSRTSVTAEFPHTRTGTAWSTSSGSQRRLGIRVPQRLGEVLVRQAHLGQVRIGQPRDRAAHRHLVHGRDHLERVPSRRGAQPGHRGRSPRTAEDQPGLPQPQQGLTHRYGSRRARPPARGRAAAPLARRSRRRWRRGAGGRRPVAAASGSAHPRWNRHAIYWFPGRDACQGVVVPCFAPAHAGLPRGSCCRCQWSPRPWWYADLSRPQPWCSIIPRLPPCNGSPQRQGAARGGSGRRSLRSDAVLRARREQQDRLIRRLPGIPSLRAARARPRRHGTLHAQQPPPAPAPTSDLQPPDGRSMTPSTGPACGAAGPPRASRPPTTGHRGV